MTGVPYQALWLVPALGSAALVVVVWRVVRRYRGDRDRRLHLFAFAQQRGWEYVGADRHGLVRRWNVPPFGTGTDRRASHVVVGTWGGRRFVAFDYSYGIEVSAPDGTTDSVTRRYRVTAVPLPGTLPALEVARRSASTRVRSALTEDIELESDAFNRRFRVQCNDRKLASDVLHPRTMEALLRVDPAATIRTAGCDLLAVGGGGHTPETLAEDLEALASMADGIPGFVWSPRR